MSNKGYYYKSFNTSLNYFYENNVPVNLVYNDGSEQTVYIISFDDYNIICQDLDKKKSFIILKHSIRRIETEIKLENVIKKAKK